MVASGQGTPGKDGTPALAGQKISEERILAKMDEVKANWRKQWGERYADNPYFNDGYARVDAIEALGGTATSSDYNAATVAVKEARRQARQKASVSEDRARATAKRVGPAFHKAFSDFAAGINMGDKKK